MLIVKLVVCYKKNNLYESFKLGSQDNKSIEKLFIWLFFGVIIALLPLLARYIGLSLRNNNPQVANVICNGELLIICVGMLSAAIGELITWDANQKIVKIILSGTAVVLLVLTIFLFADISTIDTQANENKITQLLSTVAQVQNSTPVPNTNTILEKKVLPTPTPSDMVYKMSFLIYFLSLATSACCISLPETNV